MKPTIITKLLSGVILILSFSFAEIALKKDSSGSKKCLKVNGTVIAEGNKTIDAEISLLEKNEEMEWIKIASVPCHNHGFAFNLDVNKYYTIEISKPGFVKRFVVISTNIPSNVTIKPAFEYFFEVELFKEKEEMHDQELDFPIALIGYNPGSGVFENNHNYIHDAKKTSGKDTAKKQF